MSDDELAEFLGIAKAKERDAIMAKITAARVATAHSLRCSGSKARKAA
jgi:hypothetical protein